MAVLPRSDSTGAQGPGPRRTKSFSRPFPAAHMRRKSNTNNNNNNNNTNNTNNNYYPSPFESEPYVKTLEDELYHALWEPPSMDLHHRPSQARLVPLEQQADLVKWEPLDAENPHEWSRGKRLFITFVLNLSPFVVNISPGILSGSGSQIAADFPGTSDIELILIVTLFLIGYTIGPLIFGPLSERIGRRVPIMIGMVGFASLSLPVALAQNFYTILICRLIGGVFGSAVVSVTGGAIADVWPDPVTRGIGMDVFVLISYAGPAIGPIIGTYTTLNQTLGWRWCIWITVICAYACLALFFVCVPETYAPVLLSNKARRLRLRTKNWALHSELETKEPMNFTTFLTIYLVRPLVLLTTEPMYLLMNIYMAFIYALEFLLLEGFPVNFIDVRGWAPGPASLAFISLIVGGTIGFIFVFWYSTTIYAKQLASTPGVIIPERRLPPMILTGLLLPPGFFWAAWTSQPSTPWIVQILAYTFVGISLYVTFLQGFKYIVDVYLPVANSAIAGNMLVRSTFGAAFPIFTPYMYSGLGVAWATSTLGFISLALVPVPIVCYIYGEKIRRYSKNALLV